MADYINITRVSSNVEPAAYMTITVRHGAERLEVEMSMEDFAMALTGMGHVPVDIKRWPAPADWGTR